MGKNLGMRSPAQFTHQPINLYTHQFASNPPFDHLWKQVAVAIALI
ncbi:hypothetical protein H6G74_03645 [Nostoc spongiaeforme FACHB-130]|uniref:Uncharacterized protein n=1 Tax=Nostoc spongiaeforme FACHB-130 TaxID=1357510 RepID=A0ABR8FQ22_9NOSO|nr:hypothetical protein [Nostoc spongiaeforme]MBD2593421.1 hypothetical protein [Nostoc spongiaeforme FACHB-130]